MIKFPDNRWNIKLDSPYYSITEYELFPQYTRQTSEEGLDKITITLRGAYNGALVGDSPQYKPYRWVETTGFMCEYFTKYIKEQKEVLVNNVWVPTEEYRKGALVERNSEYCGYVGELLVRWVIIPSEFICQGFNKY